MVLSILDMIIMYLCIHVFNLALYDDVTMLNLNISIGFKDLNLAEYD